MQDLQRILQQLPARHRAALLWFFERTGEVHAWTPVIEFADEEIRVAMRAKGIYVPEKYPYAFSVKQTLRGKYPDRRPVYREDGTWLYCYYQEAEDPTSRDSLHTNRALMSCWRDGVPVGVLVQTKSKPKPTYKIIGVATVANWDQGYFYLEGFARKGLGREGESYAKQVSLTRGQASVVAEGQFNSTDGIERTLREIAIRRGQPKFRVELIEAYNARCAISGYDALSALEAAHIVPYHGESSNRVTNGLLLRADLHTLFDLHLISVDAETEEILIADQLRPTAYKGLSEARLALPERSDQRPSLEALRKHRTVAHL